VRSPDILYADLGCCKRLLRVRKLLFSLWQSKRSFYRAQALSETSWNLRSVGAAKREMEEKLKAEGPDCGAEALARLEVLPAAPAVDDARFDSGIILSGAGKVRV
jgi:hypothetical protein